MADNSLSKCLRDARPEWTQRELATAKSKLNSVGIVNADELAAILKDEGLLNTKLREVGLKVFSPFTLRALSISICFRVDSTSSWADAEETPSSIASASSEPAAPCPKTRPGTQSSDAAVPPHNPVKIASEPPPGKVVANHLDSTQGTQSSDAAVPPHNPVKMVSEPRPAMLLLGPAAPKQLVSTQGTLFAVPPSNPVKIAPDSPPEKVVPGPANHLDTTQAVDQPQDNARKDLHSRGSVGSKVAAGGRNGVPESLEDKARAGPAEESPPLDPDSHDVVDKFMLDRATSLRIPVNFLEHPEQLPDLVDAMEKLERMTATKLLQECTQRGIPVDEDLSRKELVPLLRDTMLRNSMNLQALRDLCVDQGFPIEEDQPRSDLLQLLVESEWEAAKIPAARFPTMRTAYNVLAQVNNLQSSSSEEIEALCEKYGLPRASDRLKAVAQLRQALIWRNFAVDELCAECEARGVSPDVSGPDTGESAKHAALLAGLIASMNGVSLEARGIPVQRLTNRSAEVIARLLDALQQQGTLTLQMECRKMGIVASRSSDRLTLLGRLKRVIVWKHQTMSQLQTECQMNGVTPSDKPDEMVRRLIDVQNSILDPRWEEMGVPLQRLEGFDVARRLISQLNEIDQLSKEELFKWYKEMGLPQERDIKKAELKDLLRAVTIWEMLPLDELLRECAEKNVPFDHQELARCDESEQKKLLTDQLFTQKLMLAWDNRGFKALKVGDVDEVSRVVEQFARICGMDDNELLQIYTKWNILVERDATRQDILHRLKTVLVWELLPLHELQAECRSLGLPTEDVDASAEKTRANLTRRLRMDLFRNWYEQKGVPVRRLGILKADFVLEQFDAFENMKTEELRFLLEEYGIPARPGTQRALLLKYIRHWTLWDALPTAEVWKECESQHIPLNGFELDAQGAEQQPDDSPNAWLRGQLIDRLLLWSSAEMNAAEKQADAQAGRLGQWPREWSNRAQSGLLEFKRVLTTGGFIGSKARIAAEFQASQASQTRGACDLSKIWTLIDDMLDPVMLERICGVPKKEPPQRISVPPSAKTWSPQEAALFALSGGKFDPERHRSLGEAVSGPPLISVIYVTNTKRAQHHNIVYECFKTQAFQSKELIVVDTGTAPSMYFEERAAQDPRVVYRFFEEAADEGGAPSPQGWSSGFKRNVACCLARGAAIARFDDAAMYSPMYLTWMWWCLRHAAEGKYCEPSLTRAADATNFQRTDALAPVAIELVEWHLLKGSDLSFSYVDRSLQDAVPTTDRRRWLYGQGFLYMFSRAAWERQPFPDVDVKADIGFMEGLMARSTTVSLAPVPTDEERCALVALNERSCDASGSSCVQFTRPAQAVPVPEEFRDLMPFATQQLSRSKKTSCFLENFRKRRGLEQESEARPEVATQEKCA